MMWRRLTVVTLAVVTLAVGAMASCKKSGPTPPPESKNDPAAAGGAKSSPPGAGGSMDKAKEWVDKEFQPSTLSKEDQLKELQWFYDAAKPFRGMEINVLSETVPTHEYELKTLTKAFEEITGIKVNHQLLGEGEVVQAVQTQMQTNRSLYDGYINDLSLIHI